VVAFLKKSSAKNFSMEKFLLTNVDGANMEALMIGRGCAQYLPLAKTVLHGAVLLVAHLSLGGNRLLLLGDL